MEFAVRPCQGCASTLMPKKISRLRFQKDAVYRIRSMDIILARGTARVEQMTATSELVDLNRWKASFRPGDRIIIEIKTVVRNTYTGEQENTPVVSGIINIPIQ
jgi:hypothetical protein